MTFVTPTQGRVLPVQVPPAPQAERVDLDLQLAAVVAVAAEAAVQLHRQAT